MRISQPEGSPGHAISFITTGSECERDFYTLEQKTTFLPQHLEHHRKKCDRCGKRFDNLKYKKKHSYPVGHSKHLLSSQNSVDSPKLCIKCLGLVKFQLKQTCIMQQEKNKCEKSSFIGQKLAPLTDSPKGLHVFSPRISAEHSVIFNGNLT